MQHIHAVTKQVELKIRELPDNFAIYLDGWSKNSAHTLVFTGFYPKFNQECYDTAPLTFIPLSTETALGAKE